MKELRQICLKQLERQSFDTLACGIIDFAQKSHQSFVLESSSDTYFDLASLTKPLTLGAVYFNYPELFDEEMLLLLEHRGGLPATGRLSRDSWRQQLLDYQIQQSSTLYSDYSALRLMLELERKSGKSLRELCSTYWDKELCFWEELPAGSYCPASGFRQGREIRGEVNDDNAYYLNCFCSHAGLFATVDGLCCSLLNWKDLLDKMKVFFAEKRSGRFLRGWDTATDLENSLAGAGCSKWTFGHLGFTGTSIWIDIEKQRGVVILSNATQNYWYDRMELNNLRRMIGEYAWRL